MTNTDLKPEDLLVFEPGLQSLAARLVGVDQAEDLLQDTWVKALEKPPAAQQPLGPWLVRVLSNLAVSSYRSRARRRDRECALYETQHGSIRHSSTDEVNVKLEAAEQVMRALAELDELPRTIISLRYLRGMPSGRIGTLLDLPASTVRWHIQNVVAKMRVSLAKEGRRRSGDWVAALAPLLRLSDSSVKAKVVLGTGMGPMLIASLVAGFIGILTVIFTGNIASAPLASPLTTTATLGIDWPTNVAANPQPESELVTFIEPAVTSRQAARRGALAVRHHPVPVAPPHRQEDRQSVPRSDAVSGPNNTQICCRIVGEDGSPIPGAELALGGAGGAFAVADSDGRLQLNGPDVAGLMGPHWGLEIGAPGHASRQISWPSWLGTDLALGDLNLVKSRSVGGTVQDRDGHAIPGALIVASMVGDPLGAPTAKADSKGHFTLHDVARTHAKVTAKADGFEPCFVDLKADFAGELKMNLKSVDDAAMLTVGIQDPWGHSVPNAIISLSRENAPQQMFAADKNGELRQPLTGASIGDVAAFDLDLAFAPTHLRAHPLDGYRSVLKLEEGRLLHFRVKNPDGPEVSGFQWFQPESIHHPSPVVRCGEVTGSTDLSIAIAKDHTANQSEGGLVFLADGFAPESLEFRDLEKSAKPIEVLLRPEELVVVHVVHGGTPVKGAAVTVTPIESGPMGPGVPLKEAARMKERTYTTDADGAFALPRFAFHPFMLRVHAAGLAPWFHHQPGMATAVELKTVELEVGGTLVGRVLAASAPKGDVPSPRRLSIEATHANGTVCEVNAGSAPFYQAYALAPGRWRLRWLAHGVADGPVEVEGSARTVDIANGRVTYSGQ